MVGLGPADAKLVRLGENAVFLLGRRDVVARVGRRADRLKKATRTVAVSRWLAAEEIPAIHALDVDQPVVADGRVVTFWESVGDRPEYGSVVELAELLRRLHTLAAPTEIELPTVAPFEHTRQRIDAAPALEASDRGFLLERQAELSEAYDALSFVLPAGVVHGDASVGNVIRDREGRPLLADLDGVAIGPREWDLVLTALYYERFGWHMEQEYRAFAETYGYDVMAWSGYPVLRDVREFLMVVWLSQNSADPKVAAELARRISDLRIGASRKNWQPF
jgi:aminoglycoside phosphotransferase